MFCCISGQVPTEPVISRASGALFERRLIEAYIETNQRCPKTGEPLAVADLIAINGGQATTPRTIGACTVPEMLASLQAEWDAVLLEQFSLRQQLADARREASHSIYKQDAACRVIARLMKQEEKLAELARSKGADEASIAAITGKKTASAAAQQDDDEEDEEEEEGLPDDVCDALDQVSAKLKAERKLRQQRDNSFDGANLKSSLVVRKTLSGVNSSSSNSGNGHAALGTADAKTRLTCLAVPSICAADVSLVFAGNSEGYIYGFDAASNEPAPIHGLLGHSATVRKIETASDFITSCSDDKTARVWRLDAGGQYRCAMVLKDHEAPLSHLHILPTHRHLITGSSDRAKGAFVAHDIEAGVALYKGEHDSPFAASALHPDGQIIAAVDTRGRLLLWSVKQMEVAHAYDASTGVTGVAFAEDGVTLGLCTSSGVVQTWDMRHLREPTKAMTTYDSTGCGALECVAFDRSSKCLAAGTKDGAVKLWSTQEPQTQATTLFLNDRSDDDDAGASSGAAGAVSALAWGHLDTSVAQPNPSWLFGATGSAVAYCAVPESS